MRDIATFSYRSLLLTGATLFAFALPAHAQDAEPAEPETDDAVAEEEAEEGRGVEQMVVTARRREESIQDVPLSITALSGDELRALGAEDLTYLTQVVPNITLEVSRGTNTTLTAFIRGVGQQDPVAGFEAGVGIYIDDVYLNRPQAAVLEIFDVERVEVLRGPQGTLYGRNTIGGAIKYVTKRLNPDEPEIQVRLSGGTYDQFDGVLSASFPITDTLRIGGAVARFTRDGFGENLNLDGIQNYNRDILAARASVEFEPTSNLFFRVAGDWIDDDSDPRQGNRLIPGALSGAPVLENPFDTRAGLNNPRQEVQAKGISFLAEWQVNERITIKNILAYREDESFSPIDFDSLPAADVDVPVVYENDQFSEELQILYSGDWLSGILGFYYLDATAFNAFDVILSTTVPDLNAFTLGDVDTQTWSVFGDFTVDLVEALDINMPWVAGLEVSFGGRYTNDKREARVLRQTLIGGSSFFGGDPVLLATTSDFRGSETFTDFSPRASIAWRPVDEHNIYFTYSQGFKGGGFDPRGQTTAAPDLNGDGAVDDADVFDFLLFQPEEVDSFEIGVKSDWFGGRVNTSLALFSANYTDVQIPGSQGFDADGDGVNESFIGITSNAADADIMGVEFEGNAFVGEDFVFGGDGLTFNWSFGFIDAEFNEFIDAFNNDVADDRVFQNTPSYTASGTLTYDVPLSLFSREGAVSYFNTVSYRGETSQFESPNPFLDQDAYWLWDMGIGWRDNDGRYSVNIVARNVTDERYIVAGYNFVALNPDNTITPTLGQEGTLTSFLGNPRTVTGTVTIHF